MKTAKKLLVIGAHQNDSVIAVGGIMRKAVNEGWEVNVVSFGNGDEAFDNVEEREAVSAAFMEEAFKSHEHLGVKNFECFDVPDYAVGQNREAYRNCIRSIRKYQPDVILGHYWAEYFQHHEMATQCRDAWFQGGWNCSSDLGEPWEADKYFHFEVLHDLPEPTHLIDVSDAFEAKIEAMNLFKTAKKYQGPLLDRLEARARHHGSKIGVKYAEALKQSFYMPRKVVNLNESL